MCISLCVANWQTEKETKIVTSKASEKVLQTLGDRKKVTDGASANEAISRR